MFLTPRHPGLPFDRLCWIAAVLFGVTLAMPVTKLAAQRPAASGIEFFEKQIRPILVEHCFPCHGPDAERIEANLRLDSISGMKRGGDNGPAISIVRPNDSLLLSALQYDDFEMPPSGRLPANTIENFRRWLNEGAPAPESFLNAGTEPGSAETEPPKIDWTAARRHWAYRTNPLPRPPTHPANPEWNINPIDQFVLQRLQQNNLQPAPAADRHVMLRRVYLNLIGMPPTVAQLNEFVRDNSVGAYERIVEDLLSSPHYGEKWGRHWLDVVRYADSNGADENHPYPHAWRYRNYVIDAFNVDLPFDEFLTEQLAGDLLPTTASHELNNRRLTATTFLALGIKIDAEKDLAKKRADIIDEQLDTIGRSMLGMTIGCARCHDHKFDPIPTSDYYAMSGVLRSTQLENRKLGSEEEDRIQQQLVELDSRIDSVARTETERILEAATRDPARFIEPALAVNAWRLENMNAELWGRISPTVSGSRLRSFAEIADRTGFILDGQWLDAEQFTRGQAVVDRESYGKGIGIVSDRGGGQTWVEYDLVLPSAGIYQVEFRYAAAQSRPGKLSVNGQVVNQSSMAETTGSWFPDTQKWFVEGRYAFKAGHNVLRFEVEPNMSHLDQLLVVKVAVPTSSADDEAVQQLKSPAEIATATGLDPAALFCWADLIARQPNPGKILERDDLSELTRQFVADGGPLASIQAAESYFTGSVRDQLQAMQTNKAELEARLKPFTDRLAMGVVEGEISDAHILIRGNHLRAGPVVSRGFLTIIDGPEQEPFPADRSGRLQLARRITHPNNPLTARVIANRIWRWHFGRGLVESTDNFGLSGSSPTHPALLDYLAGYLVQNDWSIKALQRLIVTSRTFRSGSQLSPEPFRVDPENRFLWRWQPRRLEAEQVRDSLLKISGRLDPEIGGAPMRGVKTANPSPQDLENNRAFYQDSRRRTVYLPIVRTNVYKFLSLFDFPNPAATQGDRDTTTVPTQALFLLNNSWVHELATDLAKLVSGRHESVENQVREIYLSVTAKSPSRDEIQQAVDFLADPRNTLIGFCQTMFMSNEFLYLK